MKKTKLNDSYVGKYAILNRGAMSGLIGEIVKNDTGIGASKYLHVIKSGNKTGISYKEDVELLEGGFFEKKYNTKS